MNTMAETQEMIIDGLCVIIPSETETGTPSEALASVAKEMMNKKNWKLRTTCEFRTESLENAKKVGAALSFYLGGHEIRYEGGANGEYIVTSKGYYHYIGA